MYAVFATVIALAVSGFAEPSLISASPSQHDILYHARYLTVATDACQKLPGPALFGAALIERLESRPFDPGLAFPSTSNIWFAQYKQMPTDLGQQEELNFEELLGVSDQNAPNKILLEWLKTNSTRDENLKTADVKELERKYPTEYENLEPYVLDDDLMSYTTSKRFRWLRFGGRIDSVAKFEWVCSLSNTMGLQLVPDSGSLEGFDLRLLKELPEIRWLVFDYKWPTDDKGVFPELPKLQVLSARGSGATDEQIGNIANLSALDLIGSSMTDAGVDCLVRRSPSLKYLNIGRAKSITPKSIAVLGNLKELKYLYVGHTELATEKWFRELEKALPSCKLERGN